MPPCNETMKVPCLSSASPRGTLNSHFHPRSLPALLASEGPGERPTPRGRLSIMHRSRREFFTEVGTGMLTASLGTGLMLDLGLGAVRAAETPERLTFGKLEPLVDLLQDTAADKLQPILIERLRGGTGAARAGRRRGAGQCPHLRRRGLRRLPHLHGAGPGVPDGPRAAGGARACRCSRCSTAMRPASRRRAAASRKCCTR